VTLDTLDAVAVVAELPERPVVHLDAGYDFQPCRQVLAERGMAGQIATRGVPAPVQAGRRWPVERTHAWGNQYGKLRWCTERRQVGGGILAGDGSRRDRVRPAGPPCLDLLPLG
jgi:IS5 family transposase